RQLAQQTRRDARYAPLALTWSCSSRLKGLAFEFSRRIDYHGKVYGYLLYLKLSLTGNEGEFIRRYRLDDLAFPHDSTANQFFTEAQFEAYRSLRKHIGDKLFLEHSSVRNSPRRT